MFPDAYFGNFTLEVAADMAVTADVKGPIVEAGFGKVGVGAFS